MLERIRLRSLDHLSLQTAYWVEHYSENSVIPLPLNNLAHRKHPTAQPSSTDDLGQLVKRYGFEADEIYNTECEGRRCEGKLAMQDCTKIRICEMLQKNTPIES